MRCDITVRIFAISAFPHGSDSSSFSICPVFAIEQEPFMDFKLIFLGICVEIQGFSEVRVIPPYTGGTESETRYLNFVINSERPPRVYIRVEGDPFKDAWVHSLVVTG